MKIKDLPTVDRPREKLMRYKDPSRLKTEELLAIILGTGRQGENVLTLAKRVTSAMYRSEIGTNLLERLTAIKGMGKTKSLQILAVVELGIRIGEKNTSKSIISPQDIWKDMSSTHSSKKEQFYAYYLDTQNKIIKKELISLGSLNSSIVHPREVFEPAVRYLSAHIILCHNHPSGDTNPSEADILATKKLQQAGKILDIEVLDHVIVSSTGFTSMKKNHLL